MVEFVKEVIKLFLEKGYLINPELVEKVGSDLSFLDKNLEKNESGELLIFNETNLNKLINSSKSKEEPFIKNKICNEDFEINIIKSFENNPKKREVKDFIMHYQTRYDSLRKILQSRTELLAPLSISRILSKKDKETVFTIGIVYEKVYTKNNNLMLTIEDNTGSIKILVNNNKRELFEKCKDIVLDEVIGIKGVNGGKIIFIDDLFFPDIPQNETMKKGPEETYVAVISDIHVGSNLFFEENFLKFIEWINGNGGNREQKEIAMKVKYLFVVGDIVDGIGIYPSQNEELVIQNIKDQYDKCALLLDKIRKNIKIIICPGNHDSIRLAEPQPIFDKKLAASLHKLDNVTLVSNPSFVNVASKGDFPGFNFLMYHGFSFDYYIDQIESIRFGGGYDRGDLVMKFLLQKRHLAPTHGSTPFIVDSDSDNLLIDTIPDFFLSGHIHKSSVSHYGKTTMISGSCWQGKTAFQDKVGHHPEPGRVPIINLKTRDIKLMKFCD